MVSDSSFCFLVHPVVEWDGVLPSRIETTSKQQYSCELRSRLSLWDVSTTEFIRYSKSLITSGMELSTSLAITEAVVPRSSAAYSPA